MLEAVAPSLNQNQMHVALNHVRSIDLPYYCRCICSYTSKAMNYHNRMKALKAYV